MNVPSPLAIFGDLDGDVWGVLLGGERPQLAAAGLTAADVESRPVQIDREDDGVWALTGPGVALRLERAEASTSTADDNSLQPCRVSGSLSIDGRERELDIGGTRSSGIAIDGGESLRLFGTWFPAGHEVAVISTRPRGAKGHDRDRFGVVARGEEHPLVLDPRLSTTYDEHGDPRRVGVELWLGDDEEGDQFPRRVAGLATGSRLSEAGISAYAFQCVSRGETGAGVYVFAHS